MISKTQRLFGKFPKKSWVNIPKLKSGWIFGSTNFKLNVADFHPTSSDATGADPVLLHGPDFPDYRLLMMMVGDGQ